MDKLHRSTKISYLKRFQNNHWLLNLYLIKSNEYELISDDVVEALIEKYLSELESNCISTEFEYYRTGFAFLHYGNRGVDLTVWHYGRWGKTFEIYSCSWYCYNRDIETMELLDSAEPVICQYEMAYIINEISNVYDMLKDMSEGEDFSTAYMKYYAKYLK